jgi:hypothetical protein
MFSVQVLPPATVRLLECGFPPEALLPSLQLSDQLTSCA